MTSAPIRIVLVDTNCFLRLYQSPVLPLMGQDIGGYRLLTLGCLVDEFLNSPSLTANYSWVAADPKRSDLTNAKLKLRGSNKASVEKVQKELRPYAKSVLETHCARNKTSLRSLSSRDLELLATTIVLKGIMATDEWPLRQVATDLMEDPDEYSIGLFSSLELLHLLEANGKLSPDGRRKTVDAWVRLRENLLKGWQEDYQRLFGESADSLGKV